MLSQLKSLVVVAFLLLTVPLSSLVSAQSTDAAELSRVPPATQKALPSEATVPATPSTPQGTAELIIGGGDLLEVSVYGAPEFLKQVRVADSGEITLPLIGSLRVAGLSIRQAEELVQQRLSDGKFFKDPQVSILEKEYATQGISVLGEVQRPGIYPLLGSRRVYDAISAAGGVTNKAGNTITITHRLTPQEGETITLPPNQSFPPKVNVEILPGDTIVVSKAGIVYVVGDVRMPSGFVMENTDLTVLQAVAMAQGTNTTAKLDRTLLIRKSANGNQEIPIPLGKIMSAQASDVKLEADDIVFVPRSAAKAGFRRGLEAALQTVTGLAVYGRY
jgi:polysaccharide export outer membrane protein